MRFYHFSMTAEKGKPGQQIVDHLFETGTAQGSLGGLTNGLAGVPYRPEGASNAGHLRVVAASYTLSKLKFALALDQPLGLILVDLGAIARVHRRYPAIAWGKHQGLDLSFDDLCEALVFAGFKIANVTINLQWDEIGYYEMFRKQVWHLPGNRWWQRRTIS